MTSQSRTRNETGRVDGGDLLEAVARIGERARRLALRGIDAQKRSLASNVDGVALALRQTGANLRERERTEIGQYADDAAEQVEKVSNYLRRTSTEELIRHAQDLTRRQPLLVAGGSFAVAFAAARFLKSSGEEEAVTTEPADAEADAGTSGSVASGAERASRSNATASGASGTSAVSVEADAGTSGWETSTSTPANDAASTADSDTDDGPEPRESASVTAGGATSVFTDEPRARRTSPRTTGSS